MPDWKKIEEKVDALFRRLEERRRANPEQIHREYQDWLASLPEYPEPEAGRRTVLFRKGVR